MFRFFQYFWSTLGVLLFQYFWSKLVPSYTDIMFVGQIILQAFVCSFIIAVSAGRGIRGQTIFINEINTAPLSSHISSQFIELEYADNCLFQRHSSNISGPSLKGFYVLVIKGYNQVSESPMISVFINISGQHFFKK